MFKWDGNNALYGDGTIDFNKIKWILPQRLGILEIKNLLVKLEVESFIYTVTLFLKTKQGIVKDTQKFNLVEMKQESFAKLEHNIIEYIEAIKSFSS
jgi:hypothetical protein